MSDRLTAPLSIRMLGPLDVRLQGAPLPPVRSQKVKWLLALLALYHGQEIPRSHLADLLWPEAEGDKARNSLDQCLSSLRRALGPEAKRIRQASKHTLCLDLAEAEVDLIAFDAAIRRGDRRALEEAVALYSGPPC